jgi:hypothetical protein
MAVAMIVLSNATQNTAVHKAKMQSARAVPDRCAAPSFVGASTGVDSGFSVDNRVSGVDIFGNFIKERQELTVTAKLCRY